MGGREGGRKRERGYKGEKGEERREGVKWEIKRGKGQKEERKGRTDGKRKLKVHGVYPCSFPMREEAVFYLFSDRSKESLPVILGKVSILDYPPS